MEQYRELAIGVVIILGITGIIYAALSARPTKD